MLAALQRQGDLWLSAVGNCSISAILIAVAELLITDDGLTVDGRRSLQSGGTIGEDLDIHDCS